MRLPRGASGMRGMYKSLISVVPEVGVEPTRF